MSFWKSRRLKPSLVRKALGVGVLALALATPRVASADDWAATLREQAAPPHVVGVDKKKRTFNFFEKKSPLKLRFSYPCVTGQIPGDKRQINDLRTPEGVYFIEYKIAGGLDFREYGGVAYTLNYPNPVDKLRGKTGHGIWIHSKGFELSPTRGCVAIGLKDIAEVGPHLAPGTAVVLAEELREIDNGENEDLARLKDKMRSWSAAWSNRSPDLFDFYDAAAYTAATENFDAFRLNKERLFKSLSFIKIFNREIHALEGPGYWVTWADQLYTASNLSTEGVRRLYWQKADGGDFKIVGMEWIARDVGMRADFKKGVLVAEGPAPAVSDASSEMPAAPRVDMPESAPEKDESAKPGGLVASLNSPDRRGAVSEPLTPKKQTRIARPDEIEWGAGKTINGDKSDSQRRPTPQLILQGGEQKAEPATKPVVAPPAKNRAPEKPKPIITMTDKELGEIFSSWLLAYQEQNPELLDFYDAGNFNRAPASFGPMKKASLNSLAQKIKGDLKAPWLFVIAGEPALEVKGDLGKTVAPLMIVGPRGVRKGEQTLLWQKREDGAIRVVGSDFIPGNAELNARFLELVSGDIRKTLEGWRQAWAGASLDDYMSYYATGAVQQKRVGEKSIRRNKELLWNTVKPTLVRLSGVRLAPEKNGIRADMTQEYADSAGKKDKGVKTVFFVYDGDRWLIQREEWTEEKASGATAKR